MNGIGPRKDLLLLLLGAALFVLLPPFLLWWAAPGRPWYLPFGVWLVLIALIYLAQRPARRDDL